MTIYTAIFSAYDTLKEPGIVTPGWEYICFTDQELKSDTWKIIPTKVINDNAQLTARYLKIMFHEVIKDEISIWIDASFRIRCDLNKWWKKHGSNFTVIRHPERDCIYEEAKVCIETFRCNPDVMRAQADHYLASGITPNSGLIQSGILMRTNDIHTRIFCELWYEEILQWTSRDQIAFAKVESKLPIAKKINWHYRRSEEFEFTPHTSSYDRIKAGRGNVSRNT